MPGSLIAAYWSAAARLDLPEAAKEASDLRERLAQKGLDPGAGRFLIAAYGLAAARLDRPEAAKAASDLRERLAQKDLDPKTELALVDAVASSVTHPDSHPTHWQLDQIRLALSSIAWPLRQRSESPAWKRLEEISGRHFQHDISELLEWTKSCCQLSATDARLQLPR